jgi:hypothetical protein
MSALVRGGLTAAAPQSRETVDLAGFACLWKKKKLEFFYNICTGNTLWPTLPIHFRAAPAFVARVG